MRRLLLAAMAGLLGANTSCAKYGCPEADYDISGHIANKDGKPIEGIEVRDYYSCLADTTDADGYYHILKHRHSYVTVLPVDFRDVDGEEHGAYRDTTMSVKFDGRDFRGGRGKWYEGTLTKEVDMTLEPKTEKQSTKTEK